MKEQYSHNLLQGDSYTHSGHFVTICTYNHQQFFGEVIDGTTILSPPGRIAYQFWRNMPTYAPYVELSDCVFLPNSMHGIVKMQNNPVQTEQPTLDDLIREYKARTTTQIRTLFPQFRWQPQFHDRVIRDEDEYTNITQSICNNPKNEHHDRGTKPAL